MLHDVVFAPSLFNSAPLKCLHAKAASLSLSLNPFSPGLHIHSLEVWFEFEADLGEEVTSSK